MIYIIYHCNISSTCISEETTAVPFLVPWYEEYDYSDRTSPLDLFPPELLHVGPVLHVLTVTTVSCLVYSQWLQRKRRKRRRELVKKRQKKV